jgi:hypothetical protein
MLRDVSVKSIAGCVLALGMVLAVSAPQLAQAQGGGTGGAGASALPMFFDVNWTEPASQDGQTKVVQEHIGDANLELMQYGLHESCLLTSGVSGSETRPFSVWSGECESPFATTFRHKTNYVDLTGAAKIRWAVKTSGFHQVRPVVKLADGTMLVGETAAASVPVLLQSEVPVAAIRWITLDPERVVTMGRRGGAFSAIWVPEPDLSRVDEVGFVDLMPASGHGTGGFIHVSEFQVYGNPVAR